MFLRFSSLFSYITFFAILNSYHIRTSYMEVSDSSVTLLTEHEDGSEYGQICGRCQKIISGKPSSSRWPTLRLIFIFGLWLVSIVLLCWVAFSLAQNRAENYDVNDCMYIIQRCWCFLYLTHTGTDFSLERYNATEDAYSIIDAADPSPEADQFWSDLHICNA
jgi:hypothetical protein